MSDTPLLKREHPFAFVSFLAFGVVVLALWLILGSFLGLPIFQHDSTDQHTLQAIAWRNGHINLDWNDPAIETNRAWLELSQFNGHVYNSFPPTPTLIELPFTLVFGENTPNTLVLIVFCWIGFLLAYQIVWHFTKNGTLSGFAAIVFFFGTQILYTSMAGTVHDQGHLYGVVCSLTAFLVAIKAQKAWQLVWSGVALGLAIGCRPLLLILAPIIVYIAAQRFPLWKVLVWGFVGLAPIGAALAWYNWVRFGNPLEFGHIYLPLHRVYNRGPQFGLRYFEFNISHAFATLPTINQEYGLLDFNGYGSAFWVTSPFAVLALWFFTRREIPVAERVIVGFCYGALQFGLLLHESNGWFQFGYRYLIDIVPLFLYMFARAYKRLPIWMVPIGVWAVAINIYGVYWKYLSPIGYPHEPRIFY